MSYSRGVHFINPELDKVGVEFRTGRRLYSVNKNQSTGIVYRFEDQGQPRFTDPPPANGDYQPSHQSRAAEYEADNRKSDEIARLREMIRQRDEELRQLQEQSYAPPAAYPRPADPAQLSRSPNLHEFERARRDDVSDMQQRKRTAEMLSYQLSEKQRVKDLERQARETETSERMEHLRRMQEDDMQKRLDQRQRASDYRRMLDVQTQSKSLFKAQSLNPSRYPTSAYADNYYQRDYRPEPVSYPPADDRKSFEENAASFYGDEGGEYSSPARQNSFDQSFTRRQPRAYPDTRRLIG